MSGTEDSSQDDLRDDYAIDIWYLHNDIIYNRYTDIFTNSQLKIQTEKVGFEQLQTTGGASETF